MEDSSTKGLRELVAGVGTQYLWPLWPFPGHGWLGIEVQPACNASEGTLLGSILAWAASSSQLLPASCLTAAPALPHLLAGIL